MVNSIKKCVIYTRVSTGMQIDGYSLDAQRTMAEQYASRNNMKVVRYYEDAGKSGKNIDGRPSFKKMMDDIEYGLDINYVIVYKLSRFGRNTLDILNTIEKLKLYDVHVISVEENIDSSSLTSQIIIPILSVFSQMERENILEQTYNGRKEKARQGGWNGGKPPYGYKKVNDEFVIVEEEAEQIKYIFNEYIKGDISPVTIALNLNKLGMVKRKDDGTYQRWVGGTVRHVLLNPFYKGYIAFGRHTSVPVRGKKNEVKIVFQPKGNYILTKGKHQAIVSEESWNKAQNVLEDRKMECDYTETRSFCLSGLLKCPICGGNMVGIGSYNGKDPNSRVYLRYYKCINAIKRDSKTKCDNKARFFADEVEYFVINNLKQAIISGELLNELQKKLDDDSNIEKLNKTLNKVDKTLKQYITTKEHIIIQLDSLNFEDKHYERKYADLNKRLDKVYDSISLCEEEINTLRRKIKFVSKKNSGIDKIVNIMENLDLLVEEMDRDEQKKLFRKIIKKITVDNNLRIHSIVCMMNEYDLLNDKEIKKYEVVLDGFENAPIMTPYMQIRNKMTQDNYMLLPGEQVLEVENPKTKIDNFGNEHQVFTIPGNYNRKQPTYKQITNYVKVNYNLNVRTEHISYVKRLHGIEMQCNRLKDNAKHINPSQDKICAIEQAFKHFKLIQKE